MVAAAETSLNSSDGRRLAALFQHRRNPFALAENTGEAIEQILNWLASPGIQDHIDRITRLENDAHRAAAIEALRDTIKTTEDPVEKRRAACAILRATSRTAALRAQTGAPPPAQTPTQAPALAASPRNAANTGALARKQPTAEELSEEIPPHQTIPTDPRLYQRWAEKAWCPEPQDVMRYILNNPDNLADWQTNAIRQLRYRTGQTIFSTLYSTLAHPIMCGGDARETFIKQINDSPIIAHGCYSPTRQPAIIIGDRATVLVTYPESDDDSPAPCTFHYQRITNLSDERVWCLTAVTTDSS